MYYLAEFNRNKEDQTRKNMLKYGSIYGGLLGLSGLTSDAIDNIGKSKKNFKFNKTFKRGAIGAGLGILGGNLLANVEKDDNKRRKLREEKYKEAGIYEPMKGFNYGAGAGIAGVLANDVYKTIRKTNNFDVNKTLSKGLGAGLAGGAIGFGVGLGLKYLNKKNKK